MKISLIPVLWIIAISPVLAEDSGSEKLSLDPTKIVTKAGVRVTEATTTLAVSQAFGKNTKVNASYSENGEWKIGGSVLTKIGIVNLGYNKRVYDNGSDATKYSIGTFIPLSALGVDTGSWQVFPTVGYSHTEGNAAIANPDPLEDELLIMVPTSADSGYIGVGTLKTINERFTFMAGASYAEGSGGFNGTGGGLGFGYTFGKHNTVSVFGSYSDNSLGTRKVAGLSYIREF